MKTKHKRAYKYRLYPTDGQERILARAFQNFFEGRAQYPVFKNKRGEQSAEYTTSAFTWDGTHLTLAKMEEPLAIRWSRPLPTGAKPTTITVTGDAANRYFVSILVEEDIRPLPEVEPMVGLDLDGRPLEPHYPRKPSGVRRESGGQEHAQEPLPRQEHQ